jgi:precorrin-6B methylase 1
MFTRNNLGDILLLLLEVFRKEKHNVMVTNDISAFQIAFSRKVIKFDILNNCLP